MVQSGTINDPEYGHPGIVNGPEHSQPGTTNLYGPEYDQPVFAWEGNPGLPETTG